MSKRKRDPTFAASEKLALIDLVESHYSIVECKKTDTTNMMLKNDEWRKIALEFNAMSNIYPREWSVLKNCWENLKKRAKQQQTLRNQHFLGTGGGPPKNITKDPVIDRVLELIQTRVSGYVNPFDSDNTHVIASGSDVNDPTMSTDYNSDLQSIYICETDSPIRPDDSERELLQEPTSTETATTITVDWSQYTPRMLRDPINPILGRSPSPSNDEQPQQGQVAQDADISNPQHCNITPSRVPTRAPAGALASTASTSRRRPILRRDKDTQSLTLERINTLTMANQHAQEEHQIQMRILQLKEEQEKQVLEQERLKRQQECIKLEMLEIQLKKLKD